MAKHREDTPAPGTPETRARRMIVELDELQKSLHNASQHARSILYRIEMDNSVGMNGAEMERIKGSVDLSLHAVVAARESWVQIHRARTEDK